MNITDVCVECIKGQINKACETLKIDESLHQNINLEVEKRSKNFDFSKTPPYVARDVYEHLSAEVKLDDPLHDLKQESIQSALTHVPFLEKKIRSSNDRLFYAIKASVAGNVIDFGAKEQFSLEEEIAKIFETNFAINDYENFKNRLEEHNELLILADNAGENVFDKVLIKVIKLLYPQKKITYATRGKAIINDITTKEALQIGIDKHATVISSGVDTPGLELTRASEEFKSIFENASLILAKGMGNFECLEAYNDKRIYFLFKVKCSVVAEHIEQNIGEIILKRG